MKNKLFKLLWGDRTPHYKTMIVFILVALFCAGTVFTPAIVGFLTLVGLAAGVYFCIYIIFSDD